MRGRSKGRVASQIYTASDWHIMLPFCLGGAVTATDLCLRKERPVATPTRTRKSSLDLAPGVSTWFAVRNVTKSCLRSQV